MGVTRMVSKRSRRSGRARAAMTAGTAHAMPPTRLTVLRPPSPSLRRNRSPTYPRRAIAPLCSRRAVKPKRIMIWGKKIRMPASPARAPSTIKLRHHVSGKAPLMASMPEAIQPSNRSVGTVAQL